MTSEKEIQKNRDLLSETDRGMVEAFKVLSDLNRYRIFSVLAQQPRLTIGNLARILNISQPAAEQHLKILQKKNILEKRLGEKTIFPTLERENPFVQAIVTTVQVTKIIGLKRKI